jgi:hypothetical protein
MRADDCDTVITLLGDSDPWKTLGYSGHVESLVFARTKNLFACVSDFNKGAREFYRKLGYHEIGPMPNFLIPGSAEILLRKTAGPAREHSR